MGLVDGNQEISSKLTQLQSNVNIFPIKLSKNAAAEKSNTYVVCLLSQYSDILNVCDVMEECLYTSSYYMPQATKLMSTLASLISCWRLGVQLRCISTMLNYSNHPWLPQFRKSSLELFLLKSWCIVGGI